MKEEKTFFYCEFCDKTIEKVSPPSFERYEQAGILIEIGTILLPKKIVKLNHVKGCADNHMTDINGHYCDKECLMNHLKKILHEDIQTREKWKDQ